MLKEKSKDLESPLSLRQCKWRNVYFDKQGITHAGNLLCDTKEEAEAAALIVLGIIEKHLSRNTNGVLIKMMPPLSCRDYAWHMQIPILD